MKLITCPKCNDLMVLVNDYTRTCFCGHVGGKYLDDNVTAVVNKDALVVGIDNNGFSIAKQMANHHKKSPYRVDYFFTGWIPTKPGEIIVVETVEDVLAYDYHLPEEEREYTSTLPTEIAEENEKREPNPVMTWLRNIRKSL